MNLKGNISIKCLSFLMIFVGSVSSLTSMSLRSRNIRTSGSIFPLISETIREPIRSRQTQCVLHMSLYNIGDTWHPNMSENDHESEGINYCLICECLPRMKKNRVVAKTHCFNIGDQCPVPKCDDPILLPKRCCKTCPGETNNFEANFTKSRFTLNANKKERNYYAILTPENKEKKSFAYLQINRGHLLYIIETISSSRPKYVRFYDRDDNMLEEFVVNGTTHDVENFKIFGNWSRIPSDYRRMVRKGAMKISIAYNPVDDVDIGEDDLEELTGENEMIGTIHKFASKTVSILGEKHTHYYNLLSARKPKSDNFLRTIVPPPRALKSIANDEASWNTIDTKCYYEARIYQEGSQWVNQNDPCEMCSCKRGRVECATEICMTLTCPEQVRVPGQCCPICKYPDVSNDVTISSNSTCLFMERKYFVGSKWHPYMPPNGFDQCTTCSCKGPNQVKCERLQCPRLNCHDDDAYYANEYDCCKRCPNKVNNSHITSILEELRDAPFEDPIAIMKAKTQQQLSEGGCQIRDTVRENGEEWNPILGSLGVDVCVKCKCKDGRHTCVNLSSKCVTPVDCVPIRKKGECCLVCENDSPKPGPRRRHHF